MQRGHGRRDFLKRATGTLAVAALGRAGPAVAATPAPITQFPLRPGITLYRGAGANVVGIESGAGVLLVDAGLASQAKALRSAVEADGRQIHTLVNTHWHLEQTGGNDLLGAAGVRIVAHEYTRQWMQRPITVPWQQRTYDARAAAALPTQTFRGTLALDSAQRPIRLGYLGQAHTDTDIYVHLPQDNLLIVGDVFAQDRYPTLDYSTGGWIGGLLDANKMLLRLADDATRIVAATGEVVGKAELQAQADMLEVLKDRIWQLMRKGHGEADVIAAAPTAEYDAQRGDPAPFLAAACKGLWSHVREMRGVV